MTDHACTVETTANPMTPGQLYRAHCDTCGPITQWRNTDAGARRAAGQHPFQHRDRADDLLSTIEIHAAWARAARYVDAGTVAILAARKALLGAGLGDDHPEAKRLDDLARQLADAHDRYRDASVRPVEDVATEAV